MSIIQDLEVVAKTARPLIEQALDVAEQIAALRDLATAKGLDWSSLKALLKAQIEDSRDDGKRVKKIVERADFSNAYADMLGLTNMNEKNISQSVPPHDPDTGELRGVKITTVEASAEMVDAIKANWTPDAGPMPYFLVRKVA